MYVYNCEKMYIICTFTQWPVIYEYQCYYFHLFSDFTNKKKWTHIILDIEICITTYNYIVCVHCCNLCIDSGRQNKTYKNVCYSASLNSRIFIRGVSFASNPPFFKRIRNFCFCTSSFFILVQSLNQRSVTLISKQSVEKKRNFDMEYYWCGNGEKL